MDPSLRTPQPIQADRSSRRRTALERARGGALQGAGAEEAGERIDEPIESSITVVDADGGLLTPHLDAWMQALRRGRTEPPSPRGVASELCALAEVLPPRYSGALGQVAGEPVAAFLRCLSPIELRSFLRLLLPAPRDELLDAWSSGLPERLERWNRDRVAAAELVAFTRARPRSFGRFLETVQPGLLQRLLRCLPVQGREELLALLPETLRTQAIRTLRGGFPANSFKTARPRSELREGGDQRAAVVDSAESVGSGPAGAPEEGEGLPGRLRALSREAAPGDPLEPWLGLLRELETDPVSGEEEIRKAAPELCAGLGAALVEAVRRGLVPPVGSPERRALQRVLGRSLLEGGVAAWRRLGPQLNAPRHVAGELLRDVLEGLREAALETPEAPAASVALQIPFSLADRIEGRAGIAFLALGRHSGEDFLVLAREEGLWGRLVRDALQALS